MSKNQCLQCASKNKLINLVNLGNQPWCNDYQTKKLKIYPLKVNFCNNCYGAQLSFFLKKEKMFSDNYYLSGDNIELNNHFKKISNLIKKRFSSNLGFKRKILDIGSNDGSFLYNFKKDWQLLGIEPSKKAITISKKKKIKSLKTYFNYKIAQKINTEFDVIHASGVFFHLEELISCIKGIKLLLKTRGLFIVQFINLSEIVFKNHFDQIYHEHLYYYSLNSLKKLLERFDLEIIDATKSTIHGGSTIAFISHKGIFKKTQRMIKFENKDKKNLKKFLKKTENFEDAVKLIKINFLKRINYYKRRNYSIYMLGAPAKASTIVNYFKINKSLIKKCYDINQYKIGKNVPGTKIKIYNENKIKKINSKEIFLIMSWNYKNTIIKKFRNKFGKKFKYFFPYKH